MRPSVRIEIGTNHHGEEPLYFIARKALSRVNLALTALFKLCNVCILCGKRPGESEGTMGLGGEPCMQPRQNYYGADLGAESGL